MDERPETRARRRRIRGRSLALVAVLFIGGSCGWLLLFGFATPLHVASLFGATGVAKAIMPRAWVHAHSGGGILLTRILGCTPLHVAATISDVELMRALIAHGAEVDAETANHQTPLLLAIEQQCDECVRVLIDAGAGVGGSPGGGIPLLEALWRGNEPIVGMLLGGGADPNERDEYGNSAETMAYVGGRGDAALASRMVEMLRAHGMRVIR